MSADRIGVRTGETLRGVIARYGELSAAAKALLILGAIELGTPVAELEAEIATLIGAPLQPLVRARLLALLNVGSTPVQLTPVPAPIMTDESTADDPFAVGFDV